MLLLHGPDFAHQIARDGLSIPDVQQILFDKTRTPVERWPKAYWPTLEERGYIESDGTVPLAARPDQFLIAVAGGESGHHALYFCTFGLTWTVSRSFENRPALGDDGEVCELPGTGAA